MDGPADVGQAEATQKEVPEEDWGDVGAALPAEKVPRALIRERSEDGRLRFRWTVDAKKFWSKDRVTVSPPFNVPLATETQFKMMILPKAMGVAKGGGSFQKAKGKGRMQLKCEDQLHDEATSILSFQFSIIDSRTEEATQCAPCTHNFAQKGVCDCEEELEFRKITDESTKSCVVCLEILLEV